MIFGDRFAPADSAEPAHWLGTALAAQGWTVGGLLPSHYESYVLIEAAPPDVEDWWEAQRAIIAALAGVLVGFTDTPAEACFAVWDGHGFDRRATRVAWTGDVDPTPEQVAALERARAEARESDARFVAEAGRELRTVPRFDLPGRTYYLLVGEVTDVTQMRRPGEGHWFRPDLWWPQDRRWFVGTDVDFWCTYVGGSRQMADAIAARLPGLCSSVSLDDPLRIED